MRLVARIATSTTTTWPRYGRKKAAMRRIVAPRRSRGTRTKSSDGGVRRPGPEAPPPVRARERTPPPRMLT